MSKINTSMQPTQLITYIKTMIFVMFKYTNGELSNGNFWWKSTDTNRQSTQLNTNMSVDMFVFISTMLCYVPRA